MGYRMDHSGAALRGEMRRPLRIVGRDRDHEEGACCSTGGLFSSPAPALVSDAPARWPSRGRAPTSSPLIWTPRPRVTVANLVGRRAPRGAGCARRPGFRQHIRSGGRSGDPIRRVQAQRVWSRQRTGGHPHLQSGQERVSRSKMRRRDDIPKGHTSPGEIDGSGRRRPGQATTRGARNQCRTRGGREGDRAALGRTGAQRRSPVLG